ncbi:MAG: RDD family protein [Lachnospiraceae bacterium]|nr:RDD family protein [Lachnospiraceae bacterium]
MQNNFEKVYAGFFVRLAAYTIDSLIMFVILFTFRFARFVAKFSNPDSLYVKDLVFKYSLSDLIIIGITLIYFVLMTYFCGGTIGKMLLKIKVVSKEDRRPTFVEILYRESVGKFLSSVIFYIGYLMMGASDEKKALHDIMSDTRVIYVHMDHAYRRKINGMPDGPELFYSKVRYNTGFAGGEPIQTPVNADNQNVAMPNGPMPGAPMQNDPMPNGPMPNGPMPGAPMQNGPMPNGPMPGAPMPNGPMPGAPMQNGPMPGAPMQNGPMQNGPMPNGPMSGAPMQNGPMPNGPMPNGSMPNGPMPGAPMQNGPMSNGPMPGAPMQNGPMPNDPMSGAPMQNGPMPGAPMQNGPMQNGPMQNTSNGFDRSEPEFRDIGSATQGRFDNTEFQSIENAKIDDNIYTDYSSEFKPVNKIDENVSNETMPINTNAAMPYNPNGMVGKSNFDESFFTTEKEFTDNGNVNKVISETVPEGDNGSFDAANNIQTNSMDNDDL